MAADELTEWLQVDELYAEYGQWVHLNSELESSERGHNDVILMVAAGLLMERWKLHACVPSLHRAMAILSEGINYSKHMRTHREVHECSCSGVELSKSNFEFKLALLRCYCHGWSPHMEPCPVDWCC